MFELRPSLYDVDDTELLNLNVSTAAKWEESP